MGFTMLCRADERVNSVNKEDEKSGYLYYPTRSSNVITVRDAPLTEHGREQARRLHELTKDKSQKTAQLLVCSPVSTSTHLPPYIEATPFLYIRKGTMLIRMVVNSNEDP
jgi:hypothetical protein